VDSNLQLQVMLSEIKIELKREARRARVRWTRLTVALVVATVVALPAIWAYVSHLLTIWF
jgi:hypothetical protein